MLSNKKTTRDRVESEHTENETVTVEETVTGEELGLMIPLVDQLFCFGPPH